MYGNPSNATYPYSKRVVQKKTNFPSQMRTYLGMEIQRTVQEAVSLDKKNNDYKWNATEQEITGIHL